MNTDEFRKYHEASFDAFCKKVIKTLTADYYRMENRKKQLGLIEEAYAYLCKESLYAEDQYRLYSRTYYVHDIIVDIHNEDIGEAIQFIMPHKRAVLLLSYFMNYSDSEIARELKISCTTVARRKKTALNELRILLGGKHDANKNIIRNHSSLQDG